MMEQDYLELFELQQIIKEGVEDAVPGPVRVRAEVASVQQRTNGHCYLELCQSDERTQLAKVRAIIWRSQAAEVLGKFAGATGAPLQPGVAVIFEVRVNYSELYGVSLIIEDIDVTSTLGEAELRRRRTLEKLEKEGLLDLQKEFALPPVPYALAVISAPDAAGYGDFRRHLLENEFGFAFDVTLFPATMQGEGAPASIIASLGRIASSSLSTNGIMERSEEGGVGGNAPRPLGVQGDNSLPRSGRRQEAGGFDAVLILRGGGSTLDLACFDDYELCAAIARCPLPVFTAIGHDRDEHAADLVACGSVKTPTALADLFIDAVAAEDECISGYQTRLRMAFMNKLALLDAALSRLETRITAANPRLLLERGYTLITNDKGTILKRAADAAVGDGIKVLYKDGTLNCTVNGKV
ncbi:MAG: exodeoxyribonuclease VII large subunit [Bacteroidales bacterium]|nr:exodeoxyribonuclease VII large subunit [Bacteroidales bacterium]